jgi:hypothetical protein
MKATITRKLSTTAMEVMPQTYLSHGLEMAVDEPGL